MDENYIKNCPLQAPGLAITGASGAVAKSSNTYAVKVGGVVSAAKTTADFPALNAATTLNHAGAVPGNLATGFSRIYSVFAQVSAAGVITNVLRVGPDFANGLTHTDEAYINRGNAGDEDKALIGWFKVQNATGSAFVPGTTALDLTGVTTTYTDNFGFVGS